MKTRSLDTFNLRTALSDGKWHHRREIPMNNRTIRQVCSDHPSVFLSGQRGYKLVEHASDSEINEAIAFLLSQVKHMAERAKGLECALRDRDGQRRLFG